jgi:hypothetical protein
MGVWEMSEDAREGWLLLRGFASLLGLVAVVIFCFEVLGPVWGLVPVAGIFAGLAYVADEKLKAEEK